MSWCIFLGKLLQIKPKYKTKIVITSEGLSLQTPIATRHSKTTADLYKIKLLI